MPQFCIGLKMRNFALPPTPNLKFAFSPMRNPNTSQWNIGCVGSQTQISWVGHVHFIFFVLISFALGRQFPVEYGLIVFICRLSSPAMAAYFSFFFCKFHCLSSCCPCSSRCIVFNFTIMIFTLGDIKLLIIHS